MTPAATPLAPDAALQWLLSLSIDVRSAAVLDPGGAVLAGDPALAGATEAPGVLVARNARRAIAVRTGSLARERLLRADLETALDALDGGWNESDDPAETPPGTPPNSA
jgi:hypothetical protein